MQEVRAKERSHDLQDLMYISVLEKFLVIGVDMLPRMDGRLCDVLKYCEDVTCETDETADGDSTLEALTRGVHSVEALDLVREHVLAVMGQTAMAVASAKLKLSKLQMAQVRFAYGISHLSTHVSQIYAASIMFGYFLRGVDKRFQLERSLGLISDADLTDATSRLEKLFHEVRPFRIARVCRTPFI